MAAKDSAKEVQNVDETPVFEKSEIVASASLFGTTPEIMAGALSLLKKDKITKQEATNAVKTFLARPVGKE